MPLTVWIASFAVALSLPVFWWSFQNDRQLSGRAVRNLGDRRPPTVREVTLDRPAAERLVLPILRNAGRAGKRFTPTSWLESIDARLGRAGLLGRFTSDQVTGAKLLLALVLGVLYTFRFIGNPSARSLAIAVGALVFGFFVPDLLLRMIGDRRTDAITRDLPDVLDQLTISVEAGLGFEAALARISAKGDSALSTEFGRMLQDIKLGVPRSDALGQLATRVGVDDLRHVVLALRQAEKLGVPLAKTLRAQSMEMREKRKFRAEEAAYKLPVKMIFPLGFCILPALFIVILGPAAIRISRLF